MKRIFAWIYNNRFVRKMFLALIAFDMIWTGIFLMGWSKIVFTPFQGSTATYTAPQSTVIVTSEKAEWIAKWLASDTAKNLADREYLLAKKVEVEKELNDNRSVSLK